MKNIFICISFLFGLSAFGQHFPFDSTQWILEWQDEFDYPNEQLDKNWYSQNGPSGGSVICSRWRDNAVVNNGVLELIAKKETRGGQDWTAANIWTKRKFHYGYFECRYKYAGSSGTNNSFWMWTGYDNLEEGADAYELDVNEGHYPNIVNTNIHNWSAKHPNGKHDQWPQRLFMGGVEAKPGYSFVFRKPIFTNKIRFSSTHYPHFHIGELRVYAPNDKGYPKDIVSNDADLEVEGLRNYLLEKGTTISSSGYYEIAGKDTRPQCVADGKNIGNGVSWIAQPGGEKWLEIVFKKNKEIGCIQFTNGWWGNGRWNGLINNFKLEYFDGKKWVEIENFDIANGTDFSEEYHTYGMLWDEKEIRYYFDGKLLRSFKHTSCFNPTRIYLSLAILDKGIAGQVTDDINGKSMKVDYVRYYVKKDTFRMKGHNALD